MKKPKANFIYIVDSYTNPLILEVLEARGLKEFVDYEDTGAGGASGIMSIPRRLHAEKLLIFMSSFHGRVQPAIELSKEIKAANPNAKIYFRSATESSDDPVFEKSIGKDVDEFTRTLEEFFADAR